MEVVGEDERQAELRGDPRAAVGRAEHPQLGLRVLPGDRPHTAVAAAEMAAQLRELLLEQLGRRAAQRQRRALVGPGRAAEPEVDAVGVQRLEHAEALRDRQRRVIGQHHPARADADALRAGGEVRDQHLGHRRRDRGDVVVLGDPEAPEAERVGALGQPGGAGQRVGGGHAGPNGGEIEDGDRNAHLFQGRRRRCAVSVSVRCRATSACASANGIADGVSVGGRVSVRSGFCASRQAGWRIGRCVGYVASDARNSTHPLRAREAGALYACPTCKSRPGPVAGPGPNAAAPVRDALIDAVSAGSPRRPRGAPAHHPLRGRPLSRRGSCAAAPCPRRSAPTRDETARPRRAARGGGCP